MRIDSILSRQSSQQVARSWLFTPATKPERFGKAAEIGADVQIIDLEDSVAATEKDSSRRIALDYLREQRAQRPLVALRINAMRTRSGLRDLDALVQNDAQPDFIIIPKVESAAEVNLVAELLTEGGKSTAIVAMIESARAIHRLEEIAESNVRLSYLLFGSADLAADLRAENTWEALLYARSRAVGAAALANLPVIDAPTFDLSSNGALKADLQAGRALGFGGKAAIHPKQVAEINQAFTPSSEEVNAARKIIEESLKGAGAVDGKMVDEAVARRARQILSMAKILGLAA
jgi:(S)-citramalyl-CoA lyase